MINERQIALSVAFSVRVSFLQILGKRFKVGAFPVVCENQSSGLTSLCVENIFGGLRKTYQPESQISQTVLRNHNGRILSASPRPTRRNESVVE